MPTAEAAPSSLRIHHGRGARCGCCCAAMSWDGLDARWSPPNCRACAASWRSILSSSTARTRRTVSALPIKSAPSSMLRRRCHHHRQPRLGPARDHLLYRTAIRACCARSTSRRARPGAATASPPRRRARGAGGERDGAPLHGRARRSLRRARPPHRRASARRGARRSSSISMARRHRRKCRWDISATAASPR